MASDTGSAGGEESSVEMRSARDGSGIFWTWILPWGAVVVSIGLLALSLWLSTAGPVDEVLFSLTTIGGIIYAVGKTLNELDVISL